MDQVRKMIRGRVVIANNVKGIFFIDGEDGKRYFVHESDIRVPGFRTLVPDWEATFRPGKNVRNPRKDQAYEVQPPAEMPGISGGVVREREDVSRYSRLKIDKLGRITQIGAEDGKGVKPDVEAENFRAYYVGRRGRVWPQFRFTLPVSTIDRGFVLLDHDKNSRHRQDEFDNVPAGSYMLVLERKGDSLADLVIYCIGRRFQGMRGRDNLGDNWIVVERRFEAQGLNIEDATESSIRDQLSTSGLQRDNDGFIPGIMEAIEEMKAAA